MASSLPYPICIACLLTCLSLPADVTVHTSKSFYEAAVSATGAAADVVDFETFGSNTLIAPLPQAVGGITFESFSTAGYDLIVEDAFGGTSGSNYLRVTDDGGDHDRKIRI
ncbi:MAG: hypothetical protein R6V45_07715 [Oceanipulchritudo sp.]